MRSRSRSFNDIEEFIDELNWSEEILTKNIDEGDFNTISRARQCIKRRVRMLYSIKTSCRNINADIGKTFAKITNRTDTGLTLASSIKFPIEAFTVDNSDEFCNPNIFHEVYPMAYISASIFALAEVRSAARAEMIEMSGIDIMSTPVAGGAIVQLFSKNLSYFKSKLKANDYEFMSSLARITIIDDISFSNAEKEEQDKKKKAMALINSMSIEFFGDDNAQTQCLYMITRNPMSKRITLIFRGSATTQDWIKDSKLVVSEIENPVSDRPNQLPVIGIHKGFREYLYDEPRNAFKLAASSFDEDPDKSHQTITVTDDEEHGNKIKFKSSDCADKDAVHPSIENKEVLRVCDNEFCENNTFDLLNYLGINLSMIKEKQKYLWSSMKWNKTTSDTLGESGEGRKKAKNFIDLSPTVAASKNCMGKLSRLARILNEILHLQECYEDYRIYITGHSLGGALGLLTALEVAELCGKVNRPVTFVGIGNPRAGTEGFRDAVAVLEREGKMRCISIHGRFDIVTMLPHSPINRETKKRFCQSGFELVLNSESSNFYLRRSEHPDDKYLQRMGLALYRPDRIHERHNYITYLKELEALQRPLQELYLNDFYNKIIEENLFPCSEKKMTPRKVRAVRTSDSMFIKKDPC